MKEPKFGSNRTQSFVDFQTTFGKVRFGQEGLRLFWELNGVKTYLIDANGAVEALISDTTNVAALLTRATKTIKKTIGGIGITADFNFVTAANQNEQVIDLGAIIPAKARIIDVFLFTDAVFTGAVTLVAEVGITSSGHELINSATIYSTNAFLAMAADHNHTVIPVVAASNVYVAATPGANWSLVTAGKVSVYITYIDVTGI